MRRLRYVVLGLILGMFGEVGAIRAADIPIFPTGPVYRLSGLVWGTSTIPGFNNNYFFTPLNINESVCVYVKNNNTTNAHTFTASIVVNSDPTNTTPSDGTWQNGASSSGLIAAISPGLPAGIGVSVSGVSQVSINLSASSTLGGSPETANVTIVQTTGNCFAGNQFIGSAPSTTSSSPLVQSVSDGLSQSFDIAVAAVNPANGQEINHVNANNGARTVYFDKLIISCSATCVVNVTGTTTVGTTCTTNVPLNSKLGSAVISTATTNLGCTGPPGQNNSVLQAFSLGAGIPIIVDLRGFIATAGTTNGVEVLAGAALTGTMSASFFWYEK